MFTAPEVHVLVTEKLNEALDETQVEPKAQ